VIDLVTMTIPADSRYAATARLAAASVAAEFDFDMSEIDDLTTAANELISLLIESADDFGHGPINLEISVTTSSARQGAGGAGGASEAGEVDSVDAGESTTLGQPIDQKSGVTLEMSGSIKVEGDPPTAEPLDSLTTTILAAVVDSFEFSGSVGRIVKRRRVG